jgi:glycosyltransferase involved in cell wall biosynthesis
VSNVQRAIDASVIIPAFNASATLNDQLAALARQAVPFEWEILLCDNGSTDGTAETAGAWQRHLPNLVLVDASARQGPGAARNIGASRARGQTLLFCDADDVVADDWLHFMCSTLRSADFVAGGRSYTLLNSADEGPQDFQDPLFTKEFLPQLPAGSGSNLGVRTSVFREIGGFDESMRAAEDIDLCWRIQLAGHRLVAQPAAIVNMRRRSGLRAIFKQSYAYGAGDKMLQHKYAELISSSPAFADASGESATSVDRSGSSLGIRGSVGRAVRLHKPNLAFTVDRVAHRLGLWFGAINRRAPRVVAKAADALGATNG